MPIGMVTWPIVLATLLSFWHTDFEIRMTNESQHRKSTDNNWTTTAISGRAKCVLIRGQNHSYHG
jgi:hypothetical protein